MVPLFWHNINSIPFPLRKCRFALSIKNVFHVGAHTMGKAHCSNFNSRFQNVGNSDGPDITNMAFLQSLRLLCSQSDSNTALAHLDLVTPTAFDNQYYINLLSGVGLLPSDQTLVTGDYQTRQIVESYAADPAIFFEDFKNSMLRMGSLAPLDGKNGEIRRSCRSVNWSKTWLTYRRLGWEGDCLIRVFKLMWHGGS